MQGASRLGAGSIPMQQPFQQVKPEIDE